MSKKSHSGLKRTLAWMLTAAMMAQGCVVYADDFTSEPEAVSETGDTSADSDLEFADDGEDTSTDEDAPEISDEDIDAEVTADDQQDADGSSETAVFSDGSEDAIVSDGAEAVGDTDIIPAETGDITIAGDEKYSYARFKDTDGYYRYAVGVYPADGTNLTMNMGDTKVVDHAFMYLPKDSKTLSNSLSWNCTKDLVQNSKSYGAQGIWSVVEETPTDGSEHVVEFVTNYSVVTGIKAVGEGDATVTFSWAVTDSKNTYYGKVDSYQSTVKIHVDKARNPVDINRPFELNGTASSTTENKTVVDIWGDKDKDTSGIDYDSETASASYCKAKWRVWSDEGIIKHNAYIDFNQACGYSPKKNAKLQTTRSESFYCPVNAPKDGIYINNMISSSTSKPVPAHYVGDNIVFDKVSSTGLSMYVVNVKNKEKVSCKADGFHWTSSNPSVVRIANLFDDRVVLMADGNVGTAVLTGSYKNISIKVPFIVKGFQIDEELNSNATDEKTVPYIIYMSTDDEDGDSRQIKYSAYDENGVEEYPNIMWDVENPEIVSIDSNGILSAKKGGVTKVTATYTDADGNETSVKIKLIVTGDGELETDSELKVVKGRTVQIGYNATFAGEKVENPDINWTIDENEQNIATVDKNGVVTGNDYGKATVKASWIADNGKTYTDSTTVTVVPEGFFVAQSDITLTQGQTTEIAYRIMKAGDLVAGRASYDTAKCKNADAVTWGTSDSSIATVERGVVTAGTKAGKAVIKAYWEDEDGTTYKKEINVTVTDAELPTAVSGKTIKVTGTAGAEKGTHSWKSGYYTNGDSTESWNSNESNLSVNGTAAEAEVTGVNPTWDTVYLTHSYQVAMEGADKLFTVNEGFCVNGVTGENNLYLDQTEVNVPYNSTATVTAIVYDSENANTDPAVKWTSSDPSVVTVTASNKNQSKAKVTAVVPGSAEITAEWNGLKAICKVNVTSDPLLLIDPVKATVKQGSDLKINVKAWDGTQYVEKPEITWTSANEKVATVKDGVVTAVSRGNAIITAEWNGIEKNIDIEVTATRIIGVSVKWNDGDNQDGIRPDKVKVQLTANNENYGEVVELNEANKWEYSWSGLDVDAANGSTIAYRLETVDVDSKYTAKVTGSADDGAFVVTYSHETAKTEVSASVVWNDNDDQDGIRPSNISVQLKADGTVVGDKVTLDASGNWKKTWTNLPENKAGKKIVYEVEYSRIPSAYETKTTGSADTGYTVTASYTPKTTDVAVSAAWNDEDNRDGVRPTEVTAVLLANGEATGKTLTLTAKDGWKGSFKNVAVNAAGKAITYTLKSVDIDGYICEVTDGLTLTYTHKIGTVSVTASVKWDDAENQDGIRPDSVEMQLFADEEAYGDSVTVKESDNWTKIWNSLPAKKAGTAVKYEVKISGISSSDYTTEMSGSAEKGYVLTASHTTAVVNIPVSVSWNDAEDQDGIRPTTVDAELFANGKTTGKKVTLTAENGWKGSFEALPAYSEGKAITYTLKSGSAVEGYTETSTGDVSGLTLTLAHETAVIDVTVVTDWEDANDQDGNRPEYYTVQLYANGKKSGEAVTLNTSNKFAKTWKGLQKNSAGKAIEYTVKASGLTEGYETTVSGNTESGFTVINTYVPTTVKVPVSVQWNDAENQDGIQPAEVTAELYADGTATGNTVILNAENNWNGTFAEVNAKKDGKAIEYKVVSTDVTGYECNITGSALAENGFDIVYTHTPEVVSITSEAVWKDSEDQDGIRPADIVLSLYADGKNIDKTIVKENDEWITNWAELPKYQSGKEVVYTVKASEVNGYTVNVTGYTAEYVHETEKVTVTVKNTWNDADNLMAARPLQMAAELFANGISTGKKMTLMSANNWTAKVSSLDKNSAGKKINYTVKVTVPSGYTVSGTTADQKGSISLRATYKINKKFSVKLSAAKLTYNGKAQKPKVTVKVGNKTLNTKYYTVTYKNNKNTGYATVLVQGKGNYAAYAAKTSFAIVPKQMRTPSVKSSTKKKLTVSWVRDPQATQYIIQYSQNKSFKGKTTKTETISKNTIKSKTFTSLAQKNYYVRIRSVKVVNGKKLYSSWSKTARVKVK